MCREMIINELNKKGYNAVAKNKIENGVELEGILFFTDSNISTIIYTESIIESAKKENKSLDEIVSEIIRIYETDKTLNFDVNTFFDKQYILENIYIGLQKCSVEDIEKKPCFLDGIESYLYVRWEDGEKCCSVKVTEEILNSANVTEFEAWEKAEINTNLETEIESVVKVIAEMMEMELPEEMEQEVPMFVLTNKKKLRGASAILNNKALVEFGAKYHTKKLVVLPSSIHEMILIPYDEEMVEFELDELSQLVTMVNNTEVKATERLTDRAYILNI